MSRNLHLWRFFAEINNPIDVKFWILFSSSPLSPVCCSLFLRSSCSSLCRSSSLQGRPSWSRGTIRPWKGHWGRTAAVQDGRRALYETEPELKPVRFGTLTRSCRWHSVPLPSGALQEWLTGTKFPGKEMYLLLLWANRSWFSTSSSTSAGTQNWCWEADLPQETTHRFYSIRRSNE